MTRGGKKYYVTFIDDFSRYTRLYLIRNKDEDFETFLIYKSEVENELNSKIKRVISNRGGEYILLMIFMKNIIHEVTFSYSPQSNGVAESRNRTLKRMMNCKLVSSCASDNLWREAILSSCHLQNKIFTRKMKKIQ